MSGIAGHPILNDKGSLHGAKEAPLKIPSGWFNYPRSLARHGYFEPGEGICALLEDHGFGYIRPIMMDNYDIYLIGGCKGDEDESFFVWNPISGTILSVRNKNLAEVVETMGRSVLALKVVDLDQNSKPREGSPVPGA